MIKYTISCENFEYSFHAVKKEEAVSKFIKAVDLTWPDNHLGMALHAGLNVNTISISPTLGGIASTNLLQDSP